MCGICGFSGKLTANNLTEMVDTLAHRGPDSRGDVFYEDTGIGLGHRRLAIIDLSPAGNQPMFDDTGNIVIVFNGEIYNFQTIKHQLATKYTFKSNSDTEVIINSYKEWGFDCVNKFNGMFSFVIYDKTKNLLFGARDKIGEKPLKYYYDGTKFIFASEIKAILKILEKAPDIDPLALHHYLTLQYIPSPLTGFKNVFKLPPAHYFVFQNGHLEITKYWTLDFSSKNHLSEQEWEQKIIGDLEKSVTMRMIADVPVGALLSGGLDSSTVVALMAKNSKQPINTFSIGFDNKIFDESIYAKQVSEIYGTSHNTLRVTSNDLMELLPTLMDYYDEPIADNSILPTFLVSKLTREQVTVALDGDGGDENFAGYERYNIVDFLSKYKKVYSGLVGSFAITATRGLLNVYPTKFTERLSRFTSTSRNEFYSAYANYNCFFTEDIKRDLYNPEFSTSVTNANTFNLYKDLVDPNNDDLDNALKIDINSYLPENLLYKTDIASMAHSLELRAPLLDPDFMQMTAEIPSSLKLKNGIKKYIFKKAVLSSNLLPEEIVNRKKRGFNVPLNYWFKGPLKEYVLNTVNSGYLNEVFDKNKLEKYVNMYYASNLNYDNNIFSLLILSNWLQKYVKK